MTTLILLAVAFLLPVVIVVLMVLRLIERGFEFKQLLADGVETTGRVVAKITTRSSRHSSFTRTLRYEYHDDMGREHAHTAAVIDAAWDEHEEGGPIAVIYSASRPAVSAPKYLVERARQARR